MVKKRTNKQGFTLVELLVFITILSLFLVTAVSVAVSSLRNLKINEHRLLATRYTEELAEWLRSQKEELGWNTFITYINSGGKWYCFGDSPPTWQPETSTPCPTNTLTPSIFGRKLVLSPLGGGNQAKADITIFWQEAGGTFSVPLTVQFAVWE